MDGKERMRFFTGNLMIDKPARAASNKAKTSAIVAEKLAEGVDFDFIFVIGIVIKKDHRPVVIRHRPHGAEKRHGLSVLSIK